MMDDKTDDPRVLPNWASYDDDLKQFLLEQAGLAEPVASDVTGQHLHTAVFRLAGELYAARIAAGMTQTELGKRAGIAQPAYARIEAGKANPTLHTLMRIGAVLGVELHVRRQG